MFSLSLASMDLASMDLSSLTLWSSSALASDGEGGDSREELLRGAGEPAARVRACMHAQRKKK